MNLVDTSKELAKRFESALANIKEVIPFNPEWRSGTGFFSGAQEAVVKIGAVVQSECPETHRRLILVGTALGTVVVFERYSPHADASFCLTYHAHQSLDWILGGSYLSIAQFSSVVTDYDPKENIGTFISKLYGSMYMATHSKTRRLELLATNCSVVPTASAAAMMH